MWLWVHPGAEAELQSALTGAAASCGVDVVNRCSSHQIAFIQVTAASTSVRWSFRLNDKRA